MNNYAVAGKPCFGAYQPSSSGKALCETCWAAELCKQEAIALDGYYDRQEQERSWWEDYEAEATSMQCMWQEVGFR